MQKVNFAARFHTIRDTETTALNSHSQSLPPRLGRVDCFKQSCLAAALAFRNVEIGFVALKNVKK